MKHRLSGAQFLSALGCLGLIFAAAHDSKARFALAVPLLLLCALFLGQRIAAGRRGGPRD